MEGGTVMRETDVAVVGAGPAGIASALTAARRGGVVALIDEDAAVGGHLRWSLAPEAGFTGELENRRGFEIAAWADRELRASGVAVVHGAVWGLFDGPALGVAAGDSSWQLQARSVILATGSTDITYPFPGWELPGVMTSRAARRLVNLHRVLPGRRVVVLGDGTDASATVDDLRMGGAAIAGRSPSVVAVHAGGNGAIEWVEIAGDRVAADCVVIALGGQPDPELAIQAGCDMVFSELDGAWVPRRAGTMETSIRGVYVVGDAAGICSAVEAFGEGTVAGEAATSGAGLDEALRLLDVVRSPERKHELGRQRLALTVG